MAPDPPDGQSHGSWDLGSRPWDLGIWGHQGIWDMALVATRGLEVVYMTFMMIDTEGYP